MSAVTFGLDELKEILVERVGLPEGAVPDDTGTSFTDLGLDSLARVELVLAIQQDLEIPVTDEAAQGFLTLQDPIDYVNAKLGTAGVIGDGTH
jgi:acyl carrier protein